MDPDRPLRPTTVSPLDHGSKRMLRAGLALAIAAATITLRSLAALPGLDWYDTLVVPSFAPPIWLAGLTWAVLDLAMGRAFHRVLSRPDWMPDRPAAIRAVLIQTGLALGWPIAFFAIRSPAAGLGAILALLAAVIVTGRLFGAVDRRAGVLTLVYGAWVGFMALLNLSIVIRT